MRIRQLEELIKVRKNYDDYFTSNSLGYNTLQSELGVLQKPIIDALITESHKPKVVVEKTIVKDESTQIKTKPEEPKVEEPKPIEPKVEESKAKIRMKIDLAENIEKILKEKTTMPLIPKNLHINKNTLAFPSFIPHECEYLIDEKKYLLFHYEYSKVDVLFFSDGVDLKMAINGNVYKYSQIFVDIILGRKNEIKNTQETKNLIEIYFNEVIITKPINNPYYDFLDEKLGKPRRGRRSKSLPKKGSEAHKGKGISPINLFEKLTFLISATKSGHNNLENDIKIVCKKLKTMGLISDKIYEKYKGKYFKNSNKI